MTSAPTWPGSFGTEPKRKKRTLSRELIVETALRVVDTEGLDALNMRRVAQELGTGAASLYAHVANKDELLSLLLDRVYADLRHPAPDPERWREQAKDFLRQARNNLVAHGDLARAAMEQNIPTSPAALDSAEAMLALLRAGGLPEQVCAYGVDVISLYMVATAVEESSRTKPGEQRGEGSAQPYLDGIRGFFGSLPAERYPLIVAMAGPLTRNVGDERFEFGLDLLLDGLVAQAGRTFD
ncbi:TetR/AcrR family transcriptional regulator [Streptacidiphilus jiangxiensis]|uniref:DNA-binding transcriptional regulator, AcrR family n=1 Tax=Streptacidiphilus jiangxiensis TaxID=235985 RepID=A0A1H7U6Z0_STRJI|nr:TetR/AcrR family transcriptional regulator [Streptacidiphilus jiangxiensis]SEL92087.1 DNA-binding transcriptional regulator, AcrR family [Streptacidiphilus jiangxiensis]